MVLCMVSFLEMGMGMVVGIVSTRKKYILHSSACGFLLNVPENMLPLMPTHHASKPTSIYIHPIECPAQPHSPYA